MENSHPHRQIAWFNLKIMRKPTERQGKLWGHAAVPCDVRWLILNMYLKQCPRASFWPMLMWTWPQNSFVYTLMQRKNVLHPFHDANLTWGLCILRMVIPRCQSQCLFSCLVQKPAVLEAQSLTCRSFTLQCFYSLYLSPPPQVSPNSFLSSYLCSTVRTQCRHYSWFYIAKKKICRFM